MKHPKLFKSSIPVLILIIILFEWTVSYSNTASKAESTLAQHDLEAVKIYTQLKEKYIKNTNPLLIAQGDQFVLYHKGKVSYYPIFSQQYNDLKSVSHVTLATFALFSPLNQFPKNRDKVLDYQNLLMKTEKAIEQLPLKRAEKIRQKEILFLTSQFIQKAIKEKTCSTAQLSQFFQKITPLINQNIKDAVQAQLHTINQQMLKIEQQLTPEERKNLFVVIPASKSPRNDNLMGQYFSKRLNVPMDSARLIFAVIPIVFLLS